MTNPTRQSRIAAALATVDATFAPRPAPSHAANATAFHKLAMGVVQNSRQRRRWLRDLTKTNPGVRAFYADLWTPEAARLVALYRDRARECRRLARSAQAMAVAA